MSNFENLQESWARKYRVPVVEALNPNKQYAACLVVPKEGDELAKAWGFLTPTDNDAKLIGQYIEFKLELWYSPYAIQTMKKLPLDIDRGGNTVSFVFTQGGWRFARASWRVGPPFVPIITAKVQYPTLLKLMDFEQSINGVASPKWEAFKVAHEI